jgi:hypothetical protein
MTAGGPGFHGAVTKPAVSRNAVTAAAVFGT